MNPEIVIHFGAWERLDGNHGCDIGASRTYWIPFHTWPEHWLVAGDIYEDLPKEVQVVAACWAGKKVIKTAISLDEEHLALLIQDWSRNVKGATGMNVIYLP